MQGVTALLIGLVVRAGFASGVATPLAPLRVTVRELARHNNTLEIEPGTEVIWADVHFETIWFRPDRRGPHVERNESGWFRAVFREPGVYRGLYTFTGIWGRGTLHRMTVIVKG